MFRTVWRNPHTCTPAHFRCEVAPTSQLNSQLHKSNTDIVCQLGSQHAPVDISQSTRTQSKHCFHRQINRGATERVHPVMQVFHSYVTCGCLWLPYAGELIMRWLGTLYDDASSTQSGSGGGASHIAAQRCKFDSLASQHSRCQAHRGKCSGKSTTSSTTPTFAQNWRLEASADSPPNKVRGARLVLSTGISPASEHY